MTQPGAAPLRLRWFQRHPKTAQALAALVVLATGLTMMEIGLRLFGVGHPVLYDSNVLYGYRPLPNQTLSPMFGPALRFNNLGLRCDDDWDAATAGHVLFLGDSVTYGGNVSSAELFSVLAVRNLPGQRSCNAGVSAWGVENIHGLVVERGFLPAHTYVTVLIEDDFYRGLTRLQGQLLWCRPPAFALAHAFWNFLHLVDERRRYLDWRWYGTADVLETVVDNAVRKLVELESVLKSKGFDHLLYISPMRGQVLAQVPKDALVLQQLAKHGVHAVYLADVIDSLGLDRSQREALFYDNVHLSREGHALWGTIINRDLLRAAAARVAEAH
jgi:hypothetical protein